MAEYAFVSTRVTNTGKTPLNLTPRVDDDGDWPKDPWNAEAAALTPGETGTVVVRFGTSWGKPGHALRPRAVSRVLLIAAKAAGEQSFRVDALRAGGSAADRPDAATKPPHGVPYGPGDATPREIVVPVAAAVPWRGLAGSSDRTTYAGQDGTGTRFVSDRVARLDGVVAGAPPAGRPDWLGQRPPVPGVWAKTFDENLEGHAVDTQRWRGEGDNYWDKLSHFSHANTVVAGGTATLRFSKTSGHQNDDPANPLRAECATGYFEARVKLPVAPACGRTSGSCPTAARRRARRDRTPTATAWDSDIMEHLSRRRPCRYNVAMHCGGHDRGHKQAGSVCIYASPGPDGFVTVGLLWERGVAAYYCNGRDVLRWDEPRISDVPACILLTLPTGGRDNDALDDATLPSDFVIDCVRVWQRKHSDSPA